MKLYIGRGQNYVTKIVKNMSDIIPLVQRKVLLSVLLSYKNVHKSLLLTFHEPKQRSALELSGMSRAHVVLEFLLA